MDIKAINIILQGLPTEIYALVSQHRVAKDIWEKIKLLMQGTSLTKQERECKLYDEFDKFTYKKGESLHEYYLRFTLLLNDMNIYKMPLEQFQIHAHLEQHERHANEVRLMHERNSDPLALSPYQSHQHSYQNSQHQQFVSDDICIIYQLVMNRYQDETPEGFDKILWGDLIIMFNQSGNDEFWNAQQNWKIVSWKLHSSSGIHTIMTDEGIVIHMLVENKYPLKKEVLSQLLKLKLETEEDSTMALELIRFVKKQIAELEPEDSDGDEKDL
ncbi:hypothetical protein Tco_1238339 [Tanacetum coccineum]